MVRAKRILWLAAMLPPTTGRIALFWGLHIISTVCRNRHVLFVDLFSSVKGEKKSSFEVYSEGGGEVLDFSESPI